MSGEIIEQNQVIFRALQDVSNLDQCQALFANNTTVCNMCPRFGEWVREAIREERKRRDSYEEYNYPALDLDRDWCNADLVNGLMVSMGVAETVGHMNRPDLSQLAWAIHKWFCAYVGSRLLVDQGV